MPDALALGIDSGTSGCKVLALAPGAGPVASGFAPHEVIRPKPGWAEQNAEDWWRAAVDAVRQLSPGVRRRVRAVAVASQREGLLPVDDSGVPLANCLIWLDRRAEPALAEVLGVMSDRDLFAITGLRADPTFSLARILWMRRAMPEALDAHRLLQPADFLVHRLTERFVTDVSLASRTSLLDVRSRCWSDEIATAFNVDLSLMPELVEPGDPIGTLRPPAARELGLPEGVSVVAGAGDQQAMALAAGASREGVIGASFGTSTSLVAIVRELVLDPERRLLTNCAALPGAWDLQAPIWTTGGAFEWLAGLTQANDNGVGTLLERAAAAEPGARGLLVLPHLAGEGAPRWQPSARGAILGLEGGHDLADIGRAMLEGIGFEVASNLEVLRELRGRADVLVAGGGLIGAAGMPRLLASMLGIPVVVERGESPAARGAALLAAAGAGLADLEASLPDPLAGDGATEPDAALAGHYSELFSARRALIGAATDLLR